MHFIKLATSGRNLYEKRVAMTGVVLFLSPADDMSLMLVNTLRNLLEGTIQEAALSLDGVMHLMSPHLIPAIKDTVLKHLLDSSVILRRKAMLALGRMIDIDSSSLSKDLLRATIQTALADADLGVISATLHVIEEHFELFEDLDGIVTQLEDILRSVSRPSKHDYHGTPSPWLQVRLLRLLRRVGASETSCSKAFEVAKDGADGAFAILLETLADDVFAAEHMEQVQEHIQTFLNASNHNLRYLGLCCLEATRQWNDIVEDCAASKDSSLQCKAFDVMALAKPQRLVEVAESNTTPLATLECLFRIKNDDFVSERLAQLINAGPPKSLHNRIIRLAATLGDKFIIRLTMSRLNILSLRILSDISDDLLQTMHSQILTAIASSIDLHNVDAAITVMMQLIARVNTVDANVVETVEDKAATGSGHLSERCRQFVSTVKDMELLKRIVSIDVLDGLDSYYKRDEPISVPIDPPLRYETRPQAQSAMMPNRITTEQFAARWTTTQGQKQGTIVTSDIEEFLRSRDFAIVERIGDEILLSAIAQDAIYGHVRRLQDAWIYTFKSAEPSDMTLLTSIMR